MWIQTEKEALVRLKSPEIDEIVEFSDTGTAQVPEEVGVALTEKFDSITEKDNE